MAEHGARRLASLDIVRGLIVAIMALDHVRIYFASAQFDPVDLSQTDAGWFFTRLVTHICAPGFFFIAGFGSYLAEANGASKAKLASFLFTRGVWLIALELTVMGVAWSFGFAGWFWFGVLWGLGAAMIVMAALIFAPRVLILLAAGAAILTQEYWLALVPQEQGSIWALIATGGVWVAPLVGPKIVLYPLLPWLLLMALGYAAAPMLMKAGKPLASRLGLTAAVLIAGFIAARVTGFGGGAAVSDPHALLAFLNVEKYPPSLQFSLLTIGVLLFCFAAIASFEESPGLRAVLSPLRVFGRAPFFFYILHIYLIHGAALLCATLLKWPHDQLFWSGVGPSLRPPDGYGFGLPGVYVAWIAVLAVLYPLCAWFAAVKASRNDLWLRYL